MDPVRALFRSVAPSQVLRPLDLPDGAKAGVEPAHSLDARLPAACRPMPPGAALASCERAH
ncbi:hypothetical protein HMPREF0972_01468 [Actinomyces sp. oral taxon 848 str. F0332]|nr:hypothetical protein HMPREF0972_01468 [Actinomyces sp. oral taxon 848 str. F0332]